MSPSIYYCKAGFMHRFGGPKCGHIVKTQFGSASVPQPKAPRPSVIPDSFYTEESLARRREENKAKYAPTRRPVVRERQINALVNEARD